MTRIGSIIPALVDEVMVERLHSMLRPYCDGDISAQAYNLEKHPELNHITKGATGGIGIQFKKDNVEEYLNSIVSIQDGRVVWFRGGMNHPSNDGGLFEEHDMVIFRSHPSVIGYYFNKSSCD